MKILFPTDFSKNACNAFQFACHLAKKFKAEICVFHSYQAPIMETNITMDQLTHSLKQVEVAQLNKTKEFVNDFNVRATALPLDQIKFDFQVMNGDVVENIVQISNNQNFDLIIMGTQGEGNSETKKMGSITSYIIETNTIPVLAVPENANYQKLEKIAFTEDFDSDDNTALKMVKDISKLFNSHLAIVHIAETKDNFNHLRSKNHYNIKYQEMRELKEQASIEILHGHDKVNTLDEFIEEEKIDLLAMVRRNSLANSNGLIHKMLMHTDTPLLVFPKAFNQIG